jgi:hypothetical protein
MCSMIQVALFQPCVSVSCMPNTRVRAGLDLGIKLSRFLKKVLEDLVTVSRVKQGRHVGASCAHSRVISRQKEIGSPPRIAMP